MSTTPAARPAAWLTPRRQLLLVLLVAAAFRLWAIDRMPPGLFGDEAAEGLDALDVLAGRGQIFFPSNYGREGLYIWLVAASIKLLRVTPFATRLPAILLGIATCGLAWWAARELLEAELREEGARWVRFLAAWGPLLTGLFLATAYWHVHFSRFSQRTILTPFAAALAVGAFWRGVRTGRLRWWALAGAGIGLGLHGYSVGRFFPVFVALFLLLDVGSRRRESVLARQGGGVLVMIAAAAVVFAPLGYYFLTHPGSFFQRASAVATYSGGGIAATVQTIGRAAWANVLQYVLPGRGDLAQFHNLPGRPVFEPVSAALALVGFALCLRFWRRPAGLFLLLWTAVMTLPAALATDRFPTLPRVLGVLPGLYLYPVIGLAAAVGLAWRAWPRWGNALASGLVVAALLVPAGWTARDYFVRWGPSQATFDAFEGDMAEAWQFSSSEPAKVHRYLSSDIYRHPTYMYLAEHTPTTRYFEVANPRLSWFDGRGALPLPLGQGRYEIGSSAALGPEAAAYVPNGSSQTHGFVSLYPPIPAPDGSAALTVLYWNNAQTPPDPPGQAFGPNLSLISARWVAESAKPRLELRWRAARPVPEDWGGYRLEVAAEGQTVNVPFDAFRPPEWVAGGRFLTWHTLDLAERPGEVRLRLLRVPDGAALGEGDGWQTVAVR